MIACTINGMSSTIDRVAADNDFFMAFNASMYNHLFTVPAAPSGGTWVRIIDTSFNSPNDILEIENGIRLDADRYYVHRQSLVVFISKKGY